MTIDRPRLQRIAERKIGKEVKREARPHACRHCKNKSFVWDFKKMIKTCKQCHDESGVI